MAEDETLEICPDCRLALPRCSIGVTHAYLGASASCWALYGALLEREYSSPAYMAIHRSTVDTYAAQHPGKPEGRTIQSINVHLVGLYLTLERELHPDFVRRAIRRLAERKSDLRWLEPPANLGTITVADAIKAETPEEHRDVVLKWSGSVWAAWKEHRAEIVRLADEVVRAL
jgi:hypothetical protein